MRIFNRGPKTNFKRFVVLLFPGIQLFGSSISAQAPVINSFSPTSGIIGTVVTITGNNFSAVSANNIVYFGGAKATILNSSTSSITVKVPLGATFQPISVTTNKLTAFSVYPFSVTFPGNEVGFYINSFAPHVVSSPGTSPASISVVDLDGDGNLDMVAANYASNSISIFRNTGGSGNISFATKIDLSVGNNPTFVSIADLNGDGKQDLIITNSTSNSISIFENNSDINSISFAPKIDLTTGTSPLNTGIGDLDKDGKPDIICTNSGSNNISVFRNTSSSPGISFAPKLDFPTGRSPSGITVGDVDGDGLPDIVVTNQVDNSISILRNKSTTGLISLDAKKDLDGLFGSSVVVAVDLNGDGRIDLANTSTNGICSIFKNNSSPNNISFSEPAFYFLLPGITGLSIEDLDGDGKPDLALSNNQHADVSVLKNLSTPDSILFAGRIDYGGGITPMAVFLADLDGDGKNDIVSASYSEGKIYILRNETTNPFINSFSPTTGSNGSEVTITGLNLSTTTDLSFGGTKPSSFNINSPTSVSAVINAGTTGEIKLTTHYGSVTSQGFIFSKLPTIAFFSPASGSSGAFLTIKGTNFLGTTAVSVGGFPVVSFQVLSATLITATVGVVQTGNLDIQVTNPFGTAVIGGFYTGPTIGSFFPTSGPAGTTVTIKGTHFSQIPANNIVYFGAVRGVITAVTDSTIVAMVPAGATYQPVTVTTDSLTAYSINSFNVTFKGTGGELTDSSFEEKLDSIAGGHVYPQMCIADFNNDGKPDVVTVNIIPSLVSVFKNTSTISQLSFAGQTDFATPGNPVKAASGDFDGDGKQDLVVLSGTHIPSYTSAFSIYRNTGDNTNISFDARQDFTIFNEDTPIGMTVNDFDGDGKPDILIYLDQTVFILQNTSTNGNISFGYYVNLGFPGFPRSVSVADVDGDGKTDIIGADDYNGRILVFRNKSFGGKIVFDGGVPISSGFAPESVSIGDFDNDGKPDMAAIVLGANVVEVYRNSSSTGNVSFEAPINYPAGIHPYNVTVWDVDGDGKPDMTAAIGSKEILVYKNNSTRGNLLFSDFVEYPSLRNPQFVTLADINGDSKPDLIAANADFVDFSVFLNKLGDDGLPQVFISAAGPTEFCEGGNVLLKISAAAGSTFQWYRNGDAIAVANDSSYLVTMAGNYTVSVTTNGNLSTSAPIIVTVKSAPSSPIVSLSGTDSICLGTSVILHSSATGNNQWYRNDSLLKGSTDTIYKTSIPGNYKVMTISNGCPSLFSDSTIVVVSDSPPATISGLLNIFCFGDSVLLNANTGSGLAYQWNVNGYPIPGATASLFMARNSGSYTLIVTENGCSSISDSVSMMRVAQIPKPTISKNGPYLMSNFTNGNQWFLNGIAIPGATSQTYTVSIEGNYSVLLTALGCIGPMSDQYSFVITGVINIDNTHFIKLSPNPVKSFLALSFNVNDVSSLNIDMVDLNGRIINSWQNLKNGSQINLSRFANSMYIFRVYDANKKLNYALKILKQ